MIHTSKFLTVKTKRKHLVRSRKNFSMTRADLNFLSLYTSKLTNNQTGKRTETFTINIIIILFAKGIQLNLLWQASEDSWMQWWHSLDYWTGGHDWRTIRDKLTSCTGRAAAVTVGLLEIVARVIYCMILLAVA